MLSSVATVMVKTVQDHVVLSLNASVPCQAKRRRTDLHYTLPHYYATQVLAEMNSHRYSEYAYICFTPDATTLITGSNDEALWKKLWDLTVAAYRDHMPKRPPKRNPGTAELVQKKLSIIHINLHWDHYRLC